VAHHPEPDFNSLPPLTLVLAIPIPIARTRTPLSWLRATPRSGQQGRPSLARSISISLTVCGSSSLRHFLGELGARRLHVAAREKRERAEGAESIGPEGDRVERVGSCPQGSVFVWRCEVVASGARIAIRIAPS